MSHQLVRLGATVAAAALLVGGSGRSAQAQQPHPMGHDSTHAMACSMMQDSTHAMNCPMMSQDSMRAMHQRMMQHDSMGGMQGGMDNMMPMMAHMMAATINTSLDVMSRPETARKMATFSKNYLDALRAQGFSREEALRIVTATQIPLLSGGR